MDWQIKQAPVCFVASDKRNIDTTDADNAGIIDLSRSLVVSSRYKVVQPLEVLEFYRDLTELFGALLTEHRMGMYPPKL